MKKFIHQSDLPSRGKKAALRRIAPWAYKFFRVEGGYYAFETQGDWRTWAQQK